MTKRSSFAPLVSCLRLESGDGLVSHHCMGLDLAGRSMAAGSFHMIFTMLGPFKGSPTKKHWNLDKLGAQHCPIAQLRSSMVWRVVERWSTSLQPFHTSAWRFSLFLRLELGEVFASMLPLVRYVKTDKTEHNSKVTKMDTYCRQWINEYHRIPSWSEVSVSVSSWLFQRDPPWPGRGPSLDVAQRLDGFEVPLWTRCWGRMVRFTWGYPLVN